MIPLTISRVELTSPPGVSSLMITAASLSRSAASIERRMKSVEPGFIDELSSTIETCPAAATGSAPAIAAATAQSTAITDVVQSMRIASPLTRP